MTHLTNEYDEIKTALGEYAGDFNIEAIADVAHTYNPSAQVFEPSSTTSFRAAVEANAIADTTEA